MEIKIYTRHRIRDIKQTLVVVTIDIKGDTESDENNHLRHHSEMTPSLVAQFGQNTGTPSLPSGSSYGQETRVRYIHP